MSKTVKTATKKRTKADRLNWITLEEAKISTTAIHIKSVKGAVVKLRNNGSTKMIP